MELAGKYLKHTLAFFTLSKMLGFFLCNLGPAVACEVKKAQRLNMLVAYYHSVNISHVG